MADESFGPSLPPDVLEERRRKRAPAGPQVPAEILQALREGRSVDVLANTEDDNSVEKDDDIDDDIVGPLPMMGKQPEDDDGSVSTAVLAMEERSLKMRAKLRGDDQPTETKPTRGEWMLKLPEKSLKVDPLVPRSFSSKGFDPNEDLSVWTDTPEEKARKRAEAQDPSKKKRPKEEDEQYRMSRKDMEIAQKIKEHNETKRSKTLVDDYRSSHIGKRLTEVEDVASRPFDRDKDLVVRRVDPNKRREMINNSTGINSRFQNATKGSTYL